MTEPNKPVIWRAIVQMLIVVIIAPFIPLIISGQWDWWQAWAYAVTSILAFAISRLIRSAKASRFDRRARAFYAGQRYQIMG